MPRLPSALTRHAAAQNRLLPLLLRVCRDLPSARNELRWLREHAINTVLAKSLAGLVDKHALSPIDPKSWGPRHATHESLAGASGSAHGVNISENGGCSSEDQGGWVEGEQPVTADTKSCQNSSCIVKNRSTRRFSVSRAKKRPNLDYGLSNASSSTGGMYTQKLLARYVARRARGVPLQYILGNQPFGNLEILTRKGVLIPRTDTETYTQHIADLLLFWSAHVTPNSKSGQTGRTTLRILDLCSGTGCIALLLHSILRPPNTQPRARANIDLEILGIDISRDAVLLGKKNLQHNIAKGLLHVDAAQDISFRQIDILQMATLQGHEMRRVLNDGDDQNDPKSSDQWDVIISNPPYISPKEYGPRGKTESSVRKYEPKLALVPPVLGENPATNAGDLFYGRLLELMRGLCAKLLVMEVGDTEQASRVSGMASVKSEEGDQSMIVESWKDDSTERLVYAATRDQVPTNVGKAKRDNLVTTDNEVSDRAVVIWTGTLAEWRWSARWNKE